MKKKSILAMASILILVACQRQHHDDLAQYVDSLKTLKAPRESPLPTFKPFAPLLFRAENARDPFSASSTTNINMHSSAPLESFPLESLEFVGVVRQDHQNWAFLQAPDGGVYKAAVGDHIGQNAAEVAAVLNQSLVVNESIHNGEGEWSKRAIIIRLKD